MIYTTASVWGRQVIFNLWGHHQRNAQMLSCMWVSALCWWSWKARCSELEKVALQIRAADRLRLLSPIGQLFRSGSEQFPSKFPSDRELFLKGRVECWWSNVMAWLIFHSSIIYLRMARHLLSSHVNSSSKRRREFVMEMKPSLSTSANQMWDPHAERRHHHQSNLTLTRPAYGKHASCPNSTNNDAW